MTTQSAADKAKFGLLALANGTIDFNSNVRDDAVETITNILHYVHLNADNCTPDDVLNAARLRFSADIAATVTRDGWTPWRAPDYPSSQILESRYNADRQLMAIAFKGGDIYHYENVPASVFNDLNAAASAGSFLHKVVKANADKYPAAKQ